PPHHRSPQEGTLMRRTLNLNAMMTQLALYRWRVDVHLTTASSQPCSDLVLNGPHSPAFHNAKAFGDFERRQLLQVEPILFNQFVATHKIGVHHGEHLDRDAKLTLGENLMLEFSSI